MLRKRNRETDRQTAGGRKRQTQKSTEIKRVEKRGAERRGRKTLERDREEVPDKLRDRENHLESRVWR